MKYIFLLIGFLANNIMYSQTNSKSLYLEILGNSRHLSVNFDSRFKKGETGLGFQIGIGITRSYYGVSDMSVSLPAGINYLFGKNKNFVLIGIVGIPEYIENSAWSSNFYFKSNANLGYRYKSRKGMVLQAVWTPRLYSSDVILDIKNKTLWFGFGAGIKL